MRDLIVGLLLLFSPLNLSEAPVADITFEQLLGAIAGQESGGLTEAQRYAVVNAWGAVGKYQVLKGNVPSWSKAALGYSISWQTYRDSPALQEKIVRHRMMGYYSKYGARGAASAWYSGDPKLHMSTRPQPGGPSIKGYVDSVIARGLKLPSGGSGGSTPPGGGGGTTPEAKKSSGELAEQYGFNEAFLNANPELKDLFKKAVAETWADQKFLAELRDTKWWKTHSQKERDFIVKKYGDPATATAEYQAAWVKVRQLANQMGVRETSENYKRFSTWAYYLAGKGWDESQLRNEIGKFVFFGENVWQGEGAEVQEKLRSYAWAMGVTMTDDWYADQTRAVVRGIASIQDYEDRIRREAKAKFSHWAKQIDGGQTVADLASPYMQSMSRLLELPPGSVTVFNPIIQKALTAKDKAGMATVKPIWEFENELRNDQRWLKTKNAQDSMMQVAHQVLADFGVKY